jgi:hypothetical protein
MDQLLVNAVEAVQSEQKSLLKRGFLFLETPDFQKADEYFERVLNGMMVAVCVRLYGSIWNLIDEI